MGHSTRHFFYLLFNAFCHPKYCQICIYVHTCGTAYVICYLMYLYSCYKYITSHVIHNHIRIYIVWLHVNLILHVHMCMAIFICKHYFKDMQHTIIKYKSPCKALLQIINDMLEVLLGLQSHRWETKIKGINREDL